MEFYQAVQCRRTVRDFASKPLPEGALERILDAGLKAPSNDHKRNWEFVVLRTAAEKERALQYVKAFVERLTGAMPPQADSDPVRKMYKYAMPRQYTMLASAPCVIMPFFKKAPGVFQAKAVNDLNSFASIWCVVENIFLAAAAEGLACSMRIPVGGEGALAAGAVKAPGDYLLACYLGLGWAAEAPLLEQFNYTAADKIRNGSW